MTRRSIDLDIPDLTGRRAAVTGGSGGIGLRLTLGQHGGEGTGGARGAFTQAAVVQRHRIAHQHGGGIQAGARALLVTVSGVAVDQDRQGGEGDGGDRGHQQGKPRGDGQRAARRRGRETGGSRGHHGKTDPWKGVLESAPPLTAPFWSSLRPPPSRIWLLTAPSH